MNRAIIQTIEDMLHVPLVSPETIHALDAQVIANVLTSLAKRSS